MTEKTDDKNISHAIKCQTATMKLVKLQTIGASKSELFNK